MNETEDKQKLFYFTKIFPKENIVLCVRLLLLDETFGIACRLKLHGSLDQARLFQLTASLACVARVDSIL